MCPASPDRLRVGLLVNPVAGMGGPGGFKGSDHWEEALAEGYKPTAPQRARRFLDLVGDAVDWLAAPGAMGADHFAEAQRARPQVVMPDAKLSFGHTTGQDTSRAALALKEAGAHLICFLGGDGTAADVSRAVGESVPCLGVPAGVKITSAVYTHDVAEAAWLVGLLRPGFETTVRDVTDLDEAAYRTGHVDVELKGSLRVPLSPAVQAGKVATATETPLKPLVEQVLQEWDADALYFVGAGSVCTAVKRQFWGEPTLLGVDAIQGSRILAKDLDDRRIAEMVEANADRPVRILLSTIGGQGMLLGRGTQVFRPDVLRRVGWENLRVVAPPEKLLGLKGLHIDTGDPSLDATAPKHIRVTTGWNESRLMRILAGPPETRLEGESASRPEARPDGLRGEGPAARGNGPPGASSHQPKSGNPERKDG
jgi:predicted polyphosphate/ATP-dependent NAD kinase